jgi:FkbM family methyltransferase
MKTVHGWAYPDRDELMSREMTCDGLYQADHLTAALALVTDFSCAIDGGAHVGTWARTMSERFGRVIAVEPNPETFEALSWNLGFYQCANVEAKPIALGSQVGTVSMIFEDQYAKVGNTGAFYVGPGQDIRCEPIDAWDLPSLGFLKLDVEGSEFSALMGARATIRRCRPIVLFENKYFWKRYGIPRDAPQELLTSLGYGKKTVVGRDEIWGPR